MSQTFTFVSKGGNTKVVNGPIHWGSNLEWDGMGRRRGGQMPIDVWCLVKSYEYEMGGWWKLVKIE